VKTIHQTNHENRDTKTVVVNKDGKYYAAQIARDKIEAESDFIKPLSDDEAARYKRIEALNEIDLGDTKKALSTLIEIVKGIL
jgi:hypothetical protein